MQTPIRFKGITARTEEEQVALAVRILDQRHHQDIKQRAREELGKGRTATLGPIDLTRNLLGTWANRLGRAYQTSPMVDDLDAGLSASIGDASATTLGERYGAAGGAPMPSDMVVQADRSLRYRLGATYTGMLVGHGAGGLYTKTTSPDDLRVTYASDNPDEPTVVKHYRQREVQGDWVTVEEVYDLHNLMSPTYRIVYRGEDITSSVLPGIGIWPVEWREADGRPFHPIVISGTPGDVYRTNSLIEATLRVCVDYTYWHAMIRDAGHPQRLVRGLRLASQDSDSETGQTGLGVSATDVLVLDDIDPERPGSIHQWGPGYDPESAGKAIRSYETGCLSALGLPVDMEATGGEPTETERRAMEELIAGTFAECRRADSEVLRRAAAISNRIEGTTYSEEPYGILYRWEVDEALEGAATKAAAEAAAKAATVEVEVEQETDDGAASVTLTDEEGQDA